MNLRLIRNPHTEQRLPFVKWGRLAKPYYAADNDAMARAQSLLTGDLLCGQVCPALSPEQARDVLRWAGAIQ